MIIIDWRFGFSNDPSIIVEDSLDLLPREECRFQQGHGMFWHIQENGLVRYFSHSGEDKNEGGFGGSVFDILDAEGNPKTIKGPWSGRASYLNMFMSDEYQVADINVNNGRNKIYCGILVSKLAELWDVDAYLLRAKRKEKEQGSYTASMAPDRILKPDGSLGFDRDSLGYEIVKEPVRG